MADDPTDPAAAHEELPEGDDVAAVNEPASESEPAPEPAPESDNAIDISPQPESESAPVPVAAATAQADDRLACDANSEQQHDNPTSVIPPTKVAPIQDEESTMAVGKPPNDAPGEVPQTFKMKVALIMDGMAATLVMITATLVSLTAPDIVVFGDDRSADEGIAWINFICFLIFLSEWCINSWAVRKETLGYNYFGVTLTWWMDAAATFSMIADIYFLGQIFSPPSGGVEAKNLKAGKFTKLGRTTKLLRVLRIVRMIKLIKLALKGDDKSADELASMEDEEKIADKGSKVGQQLSQATTMNVLLLVLAMLFVLPFLNAPGGDNSYAYGFNTLRLMTNDSNLEPSAVQFQRFLTGVTSPMTQLGPDGQNFDGDYMVKELLFLKIRNGSTKFDYTMKDWETTYVKLRTNERIILFVKNETNETSEYTEVQKQEHTRNPYEVSIDAIKATNNIAVLSTRAQAKSEAYNSFVLIVFIMVLLMVASALFTNQNTRYVIGPIENMVTKISEMMKDPLGLNEQIDASRAAACGVPKPVHSDEQLTFGQKYLSCLGTCIPAFKRPKGLHEEQFETAMLNNTINKIQKLLRVGFGSAGGEIVAKNLKAAVEKGETPKVASRFGLRVYGVFGFCIIEDFNEILVALDEDIFSFVNTIAKMVHTEVQKHNGAVNKNIGEAFLLTWKTKPATDPITGFSEIEFVKGNIDDPATGKRIDPDTAAYYEEKLLGEGLPGLDQQVAADSALDACKAIAEKVDTEVEAMLDNVPAKDAKNVGKSILSVLRQNITGHNGEKFRVHMGVGLNYGWGIEGAIGSEHKVDASYLSPNVNTAARLETANHQFGTKMLVSLNVVNMMSQAKQDSLRCVECVRPKGVAVGIRIHTSDQIQLLKNPFAENEAERSEKYLPPRASKEFQDLYREGFEAYFTGDWAIAKEKMEQCAVIDPDDTPTKVILDVMASKGDTWGDYWVTIPGEKGSGRALTSK